MIDVSRKQQVMALRTAEVTLGENRLLLQRSAMARAAELRRLHPGWLLAGGFASGVIVQRCSTGLFQSRLASSAIMAGIRLTRFAVGDLLSGISRAGA